MVRDRELAELEKELTRIIEEDLPKRNYPKKCYGPFPSYIDGKRDGLTEARGLVRMKISVPKVKVKGDLDDG